MARRNILPREVLARILTLDSDDSGDDSQRDSEEEAEPEQLDPISSDEISEEEGAQQNSPQAVGRDGTQWEVVDIPNVGRLGAANVFTEREGLTRYSHGIRTPLDAFRLLIDEGVIRHIVKCTNEHAHCTNPDFNLTEEELDKFIGLLYLRGVMNAKNFPLEKLWAKDMGCPAFNRTLSRDRMRLIKKFLRFDHRDQRRRNLEVDKFALISTVLNRFVDNSQKSYRPTASLTVDEQLFPTKARCRFTQYMANKPDKFGIKFLILADLAGLNACILFKKATGTNLQRRTFLMRLSPELRGDLQEDNPMPLHPIQQLTAPLERRVNCAVKSRCKKNRTVTRCTKCERQICGKCMGSICCMCVHV